MALSGLYAEPSCFPMQRAGRVLARRLGNDRSLLSGDVQDDRAERQVVNIDTPRIADPATRDAVARGLNELFQPGQRLQLDVLGCGASASFEYLAGARLIGAPAAPAPVAGLPPAVAGGGQTAPAGSWTYGPHPVLGLSAHVTIGGEAIGIACGIDNPTRSEQGVLRMTPGLLPGVTRPEGFLMLFQGGGREAGLSGLDNMRAGRGGVVERLANACEIGIAGFQRSRSAMMTLAHTEGFGPEGVTVVQNGRRHLLGTRGQGFERLSGIVQIPLTGSGNAIRQLLAACPALRNDNCGL